jgi:hypothetical protein
MRAGVVLGVLLFVVASCGGKLVVVDGASSSSSSSGGASSSGSSGGPGETCQTIQTCAKGDPLRLCSVFQDGTCAGASYRVGTLSFPCASCTDCDAVKSTAIDYCNAGLPPPPPPPPPPPTDGGTTCAPRGPLSGFTPTWHPPAPNQAVCTKQNIDDFLNFCLIGGTPLQCQGLFGGGAAKACADCLRTPSSDPSWGPVVQFAGHFALNTPGCVALIQGNDTCARAVAAEEECDDLVCSTCTVTDQASLGALVQCDAVTNASGGLCGSYGASARCANSLLGSGQCPQPVGGDFTAGYNQLAPQFCLQ